MRWRKHSGFSINYVVLTISKIQMIRNNVRFFHNIILIDSISDRELQVYITFLMKRFR